MYTYEKVRDFCQENGIEYPSMIADDITKMLDVEVNDQFKDGYYKGIRNKYEVAQIDALNRFSDWFRNYKEYSKMIKDLPSFVASHRRAAVYIILLAQKLSR